MIFRNRKHAGEMLADKLLKYKGMDTIILALPRGGVPVAAQIAEQLQTTMDVLITRKIGAPFQPELALGALCEDGEPYWNSKLLTKIGLDSEDLGSVVAKERDRVQVQKKTFREGRALGDFKKTIILVDDGLATGATMIAALKYLKAKGAQNIVVAVPVAATSSARLIKKSVSELVVYEEREDLRSIGEWYHDFSQVSDDEVLTHLRAHRKNTATRMARTVEVPVGTTQLAGDLATFSNMKALIVFAHGSGSSRKSPRNQQVAQELNDAGFGTLLFDLLDDTEAKTRKHVFDIEILGERLLTATNWLRRQKGLEKIPVGYFGASTGAAAALEAASKLNDADSIYAVVSRGGRPDLAGASLRLVKAPTLLLVGGLDPHVLELNIQAHRKLSHSQVTVIEGATHLFEEVGALEEVSRSAIDWFNSHLRVSKNVAQAPHIQRLSEAIDESMVPLKSEDDLDQLIAAVKDRRVVMLGEASHGTQEFYRMRSQITQRLIKDHGFSFVAVEGDWPDLNRLNKYLQKGEGGSAKNVLMKNHRWPTWMWANHEVVDLIEWMKHESAGFYGLDVYSLFDSIHEVVDYLRRTDSALAHEFMMRYACFDPFENDEISYARSLLQYPPGCEKEVAENLRKILEMRIQSSQVDGDDLFSAQQNAWVVSNAESYYRSMLMGDASSWNVRDSHMMDTLDRLLDRYGEGAKGIVWAHNTHVGDYRATDMKAGGYVNLGGLARESYGDDNVALVGFGTYQGQVLAGSAWGHPEEVMTLPPAQEMSYEHHFHQAVLRNELEKFYLLFDQKTSPAFSETLGHRAVGVVYDPRHERRGNYVPTELSKRYDAFIFIDETHALKSLHAAFVKGEFPETWPSGV